MGRGGRRPGAGRKPKQREALALPSPDAPHNQIESTTAIETVGAEAQGLGGGEALLDGMRESR
jgi:hypothetical protein